MGASTNDLGVISLLKKGIEEKRQEYVRPINEHVKAVNAAFKTLTDPIEQADKITREKITAYRAEVDRKRREAEAINQAKEELARREAALNHGEFTVDTTPVPVPEMQPKTVHAEAATLGTSKVWKYEVTDFKLLPDDYKLADLVKIGKVIRAGVNIPGVKSWQEDSIRISAAR
jgi:leucyl aminopeptidase